MAFSDDKQSALQQLHGMLATDGIKTEDQFRDAFTVLLKTCNVSVRNLAQAIRYRKCAVVRWPEDGELPDTSRWPLITARLMDFIAKQVARGEKVDA